MLILPGATARLCGEIAKVSKKRAAARSLRASREPAISLPLAAGPSD